MALRDVDLGYGVKSLADLVIRVPMGVARMSRGGVGPQHWGWREGRWAGGTADHQIRTLPMALTRNLQNRSSVSTPTSLRLIVVRIPTPPRPPQVAALSALPQPSAALRKRHLDYGLGVAADLVIRVPIDRSPARESGGGAKRDYLSRCGGRLGEQRRRGGRGSELDR